ncbi:AprE Subtilisin-like serine proteases [uncultured Caudovirales phage]|uniref:AprE Subtilisin-like serine proteases n=1 Tax=uncultured Caudovirales phage TaxID=2100421 RepID=A0A6J5TA84_9CAUD|nr:AprE Subtilisin-like serine proteases [uncultured Caudovirales phage]
MREYIIQVADPSVWDTLWDELTVGGLGDNFIPERSVEVVNDRPQNDYLAHFNLTDEEATLLKQDPRIVDVELQADLRPNIEKKFNGVRHATYDRSPAQTTAQMKNWGLLRCINQADPYGTALSVTGDFTYNLDGTGVDIVVIDTGVESGHPEFAVNADGTGGSRVVDFDWHSLGVTGCPTGASIGGYLGDSDGHGSNCASISAGNTCGWAPGANIYSIRIFSGPSIRTGAYLGVINSDIAFDLVRAFHLKKIADGNPRPTVCTNSWGYSTSYINMRTTNYRGVVTNTLTRNIGLGQIYGNHGYSQVSYLNQSVNNCASAGVILVGAAGNSQHKIDIPPGLDYNNYWTDSYGQYYYHRGMSPSCASSMITVGATDSIISSPAIERKAYFSETGPRVDVYAPGVMIMGAYANKPYNTYPVQDSRNANYYLNKISGTSQATPQVAGYIACLLQLRPTLNSEDVRKFITDSSNKGVLNENPNGGVGYANQYHLQGGGNRYLYQPFNNSLRGNITS